MKIQIVNNKYLNALFLLMLFSAIVHMVLLFCFTVITGDIYILNWFNILDFDIVFPNLVLNSPTGNFLAGLTVILIYGIILKKNG